MQNLRARWTKRLRLNRSRDPLGLAQLRKFEDDFLPGITTQTQRLRYYTFLAWAYRKIRDHDATIQRLLSMEKVLTLITQYNHDDDPRAPYGTRNTLSASDFIYRNRRRNSLVVKNYTAFGYGGNNKIGYGTYYYKNPLQILRIVWSDESSRIELSEVGESVADIFEVVQGNRVFFSDRISKSVLKKRHKFCLCSKIVPKREQHLWRMVFFGFTTTKRQAQLGLDKQAFFDFKAGKLMFFENPEEWHSFGYSPIDKIDPQFDYKLGTIGRRGTLLLIMKIIDETEPEIRELDQTVRDTIYFRQFWTRNNKVKRINFGRLESLRVLWEVYVHNLYTISAFEEIFSILLEELSTNPMGTTLDEILSSLDLSLMNKQIKKYGFKSLDLKEMLEYLNQNLDGRTSLRSRLNERKFFLNALSSETYEKKMANLIVLLCLLKLRYSSFSKAQMEALRYIEEQLYGRAHLELAAPTQFYTYVMNGTTSSFLVRLLRLLIDRHCVIASIKYEARRTKSWLVTEEDGLLLHYGKPFWSSGYRESKWRNVVELLCDMGLSRRIGDTLKATQVGKKWLERII